MKANTIIIFMAFIGLHFNGIAQQSGIIFYDMKATKSDGTSTPFWENLGFNPSNMTYKADEPLTYEKFLSLTTKGFLGTSNVFDSETLSSGTTEQSYISYTDSFGHLTPVILART